MTEKRQTSQGYIIRFLQHFATKRRNITNFARHRKGKSEDLNQRTDSIDVLGPVC